MILRRFSKKIKQEKRQNLANLLNIGDIRVDSSPRNRLNTRFKIQPRHHPMATSFPNGQVAQSVEQGTENPCVGSSILSLATIYQELRAKKNKLCQIADVCRINFKIVVFH